MILPSIMTTSNIGYHNGIEINLESNVNEINRQSGY